MKNIFDFIIVFKSFRAQLTDLFIKEKIKPRNAINERRAI